MTEARTFIARGSRLGAAALVLAAVAGCHGLTIRNTSDHPVTFTQRFEGGEQAYTLDPGSSMTIRHPARVKLADFAIESE